MKQNATNSVMIETNADLLKPAFSNINYSEESVPEQTIPLPI